MCRKLMYLVFLASILGLAFASAAEAADPNLVGWWKLDDGSGTIATDSSSNGNDAALNGTFEWVEGKIDGGLHLDGTTAFGEIPADPSLVVMNRGGFAFMAWLKTDILDGVTHYAFQQGDLNGTGRSWLYIGSDNEIRTYVGGGTTGSGIYAEAEEWYHAGFVVTEAGETDDIQTYINGEATRSGQRGMEDCEGGYFIGSHKNMATESRWIGILDNIRFYNRALTQAEVQKAMHGAPEQASSPVPANTQTGVPRDVTVAWTPGDLAAAHDVYVGTTFDDVNDADRANPLGVLASQGQGDVTYDLAGLDFGQTYYWRVDEVNAAPDNTIFKGGVWSFTIEPLAYPIETVVATSSAVSDEGAGPENTVNGSGLDANDQHSTESSDMWLITPTGDEPVSIEFEFDRVYKLHQMLLWNYNVAVELLLGFGIKDATIEYSADGADWTVLGDVVLAQATALDTYTANTTIDFAGAAVKYVKLTVNSGYGMMGKFGLSEVRFLSIPVQADEPQPVDGAADVAVVDATLSWSAGREAVTHDVYLSTDPNALALIDSVADSTANPGALDLAATYYWRIDEVNDAEAISTWEGDLWSFATEQFVVVEDFESYTDDIDAGEAIFLTWVDGYEAAGNNSQVGYLEAPFAEETIVHGGGQSMPLIYDNIGGGISEATRTFEAPQDWTQHGIKGLTLWFYGDPTNTAAQMYVKINGAKVAYDGDADNLLRKPWQMWYVDLAGLNVGSVTELTIGLEGGGAGTLFIDDVMLTPYDRQQVTPTEPDPANLIAHFAFDGDTSDSTGVHPGTTVGTPMFVAGKVGQAINLNGTGDYVDLVGYQGILGASAVTVTAWINTTNTETEAIMGWGPNVGGQRFGFRIDVGRLRFEHHGGNIQGDSIVNDGAWHHVAVTIQADATISYPEVILWLDGQDDTRPNTDPDAFDLTAELDVRIGARPAANDRFFMGQIDELYLYDRALSQGEIAYQAGRTQPFDVQ